MTPGPLRIRSLVPTELSKLALQCHSNAALRYNIQSAVRQRILDLCPPGRGPNLSNKLKEWWTLDFPAFRAEIKKQFKTEIPIVERTEWETYLKTEREKVEALAREIADFESKIDHRVYELFELTPDEISLLEESLQGQY